jgi:DNA-binding NarL/FixJ family response regulator
MEILLALPSGDSVAEIATALNKSKRTVESQLEKIYAKMEVSTRAQAVAKARALGLEA